MRALSTPPHTEGQRSISRLVGRAANQTLAGPAPASIPHSPSQHIHNSIPADPRLTQATHDWQWAGVKRSLDWENLKQNNFVVSGLPCPVGEWEAPHKTCNYSCVMYYAAELENNEVIYRVITIHCLREQVYLSAPSSPLGGQTRETWKNKQSSITPIFNKPGNSEWCCQKR